MSVMAPDRAATASAVYVAQSEIKAYVRLRSWRLDSGADDQVMTIAGRQLPGRTGEILTGALRILCIGPGDWLLVSKEHQFPVIRDLAAAAMEKYSLVMTEMTDGLSCIEVAGPSGTDVLSKSCGLDFHDRVFPAGRCARTRFANVPVVIDRLEKCKFELHVARSYFHYLHAWLSDCM